MSSAAGAPTVAVLDYGMGNIRSAEKALGHVGARVEVTRDPERARRADGVVLPGDGAFPRAVEGIRRLGMDDLVAERVEAGAPLLGICIGMQVLFEGSEELGGAEGLGVLGGSVRALDPPPGGKLPHMGWAEVRWQRASPLLEGLGTATALYHVHSFAPVPSDPELALGVADYGGPFASAVERGRLWGVQFHPEKSSADGLRMLRNFVAACAGGESPIDKRPGRRGAASAA